MFRQLLKAKNATKATKKAQRLLALQVFVKIIDFKYSGKRGETYFS